MKAKIVLVHFPFTDLTGSKLRPAIVIHESEPDVIVAFISSRIPSSLQESDLLITTEHPAFRSTGLKIPSVIRFDKIATLSKTLIEGEIGEIRPDLADECNDIMRRLFRL
jgi:mRNA interferase MazF